jgi:hypothetical protein
MCPFEDVSKFCRQSPEIVVNIHGGLKGMACDGHAQAIRRRIA